MLLMRAASITWASGMGLGPGNLDFFGPKMHSISRAQPPPTCPSNGCCPHQQHYARGRINHSAKIVNNHRLPLSLGRKSKIVISGLCFISLFLVIPGKYCVLKKQFHTTSILTVPFTSESYLGHSLCKTFFRLEKFSTS